VDLNSVAEFAPAPGASWRDGDAWLGGGTFLFSQPQPAVTRLLDLRAFGWAPVQERADGVLIAATCTLAELRRWQPRQARYAPGAALARQCCDALLGSFKVHNVATVGGNICLSLPAGPMISLASALDGVALLRGAGTPANGGGERRVPVRELVTGSGHNQLRRGELLTHVWLPAGPLASRFAFRQLSLSPVGRSAVLVIARRAAGTGTSGTETSGTETSGTGETLLTVTASTPHPVCLRFPAPPSAAAALGLLESACAGLYLDDVHGSAVWRAAMTRRLVAEALAELESPAGSGPSRE
jgi:CO/xanthine dehydrogenase FAD-binding subunit